MNLTKIQDGGNKYQAAPMQKPVADIVSDIIILVPDLDSFHEIKGQEKLLNKKWEVHLLEPGKEYK